MQDVSVLVAFFSGLSSFFAPCVVPLLPSYIGLISGVSYLNIKKQGTGLYRKQILSSFFWYMIGFSSVFVLMGVSASTLGALIRGNSHFIELFGGILIMFFGLQALGIFHFPKHFYFQRLFPFERVKNASYFRSLVIGIVFATIWTPCIGPILGAILTLAARSSQAWQGGVLLFFYSLGILLPFFVVSLAMIKTPWLLQKVERVSLYAQWLAGFFLVILGGLLFNNSILWISPELTYDGLNRWLFRLFDGSF